MSRSIFLVAHGRSVTKLREQPHDFETLLHQPLADHARSDRDGLDSATKREAVSLHV